MPIKKKRRFTFHIFASRITIQYSASYRWTPSKYSSNLVILFTFQRVKLSMHRALMMAIFTLYSLEVLNYWIEILRSKSANRWTLAGLLGKKFYSKPAKKAKINHNKGKKFVKQYRNHASWVLTKKVWTKLSARCKIKVAKTNSQKSK
jgi:hypothetical protein